MLEVQEVNKCKQCGTETDNEVFCSRSCNVTHNNLNRKLSEESKNKTRKSLQKVVDIEEIKNIILENPEINLTALSKLTSIGRHVLKRVIGENKIILNKPMRNIGRFCEKHQQPYTDHYNNGKHVCYKCCGERVSNRRRELKILAIEYKGGKCVECGYNKSPAALEFHHLDPSQKDFGISKKGTTCSLEKIKPELDKCILVCANCHREIHERENKE